MRKTLVFLALWIRFADDRIRSMPYAVVAPELVQLPTELGPLSGKAFVSAHPNALEGAGYLPAGRRLR